MKEDFAHYRTLGDWDLQAGGALPCKAKDKTYGKNYLLTCTPSPFKKNTSRWWLSWQQQTHTAQHALHFMQPQLPTQVLTSQLCMRDEPCISTESTERNQVMLRGEHLNLEQNTGTCWRDNHICFQGCLLGNLSCAIILIDEVSWKWATSLWIYSLGKCGRKSTQMNSEENIFVWPKK